VFAEAGQRRDRVSAEFSEEREAQAYRQAERPPKEARREWANTTRYVECDASSGDDDSDQRNWKRLPRSAAAKAMADQ
jgi:hypothetical protein